MKNYLLNIISLEIILILILSLIVGMVGLIILITMSKKNKDIKIIQFENKILNNKNYENILLDLITIRTSSFNDEAGYHLLREKLKEDFPNIHEHFKKEKIDGNAIFTYKEKIENAPNILFATHIDYKVSNQDAFIKNNEIFGNGTFDAKSLLFVMFEAVENLLITEKKLNVNLTIVMTTDDKSTKDGANHIVDQFLRKGNFFDLVIEEGSGIVDPSFFGLKSHYALVGMGVTGEATIRFIAKNTMCGKNRLRNFINEIKTNNLFKSKINRQTSLALKEILKDMNFIHRLLFNNLFLFKAVAKKIIDKHYVEISKMLKTVVRYGEIGETATNIYIDLTFELSTHESTADIVLTLAKYMEMYNIEYEIVRNIEASKVTRKDTEGYRVVKKAIQSVFHDLYIIPIIVTKISEKRYFDKVSDCVIRFSPLYYPINTLRDSLRGLEHIPIESLEYGVNFFNEILTTYKKR